MKIEKSTLIRTIITFVSLLNAVLTMSGKNPLPWSDEQMYAALSATATVVTTFWAWWKNNSFTKEAIKADKYMKTLKNNINLKTGV